MKWNWYNKIKQNKNVKIQYNKIIKLNYRIEEIKCTKIVT